MSEAEFLFNLEVEAAAARNADLSRQLERMYDELACSSIRRPEKAEHTSQGTQTEYVSSCSAILDLDDLLFEMAEAMFRLYPTQPIDLSSRRGGGRTGQVEELAQRCLHEMRLLKTAWETKIEGYNKFIDDLQKMLGEHYRSLETLECQLREERAKCATLSSDNAILLRRCTDAERRLEALQQTAESAGSDVACLTQRVGELEAERDRLIDKQKVLAKTVVSLRAECALVPWGNGAASNKTFTASVGSSNSNKAFDFTSVAPSVAREGGACAQALPKTSAAELMWACQGSAVNPSFPKWCVSPEKVVDFCYKIDNLK